MKNKKSVKFSFVLFFLSTGLFARLPLDGNLAVSKRPSLATLVKKIEQQAQEKPAWQEKTVKKGSYRSSFLTKAISYIDYKKQLFLKKARRFYRQHFYLSVVGMGLVCVLSAYCLKIYCMPVLQDLIQRYRQGSADISSSVKSPEPSGIAREYEKPLQKEVHSSVTSRNINDSCDEPRQTVVKEPVNQECIESKVIEKNTLPVEKQSEPDVSLPLDQKIPVDQKVETSTIPLAAQVAALPFKRLRSSQEIFDSKKLYNDLVEIINEKLSIGISILGKLKNKYEVAKKNAQDSPYNIKLYNDCLKKEQAFVQHKNGLINEIKSVAQTVDGSKCLKGFESVKELSEKELSKPQQAAAKLLFSRADIMDGPSKIISNSRKKNVNDALIYEKHFTPVLTTDVPSSSDSLYYALKWITDAQQAHYEGFSYLSSVLKKVLLPLVNSF